MFHSFGRQGFSAPLFICRRTVRKTFGIFAIHNWTLTEKGGRTTVQVEESMEGLLAGFLKNTFNKNLEKGMQKWLELLKKTCEK
jgi:hypothetical protein